MKEADAQALKVRERAAWAKAKQTDAEYWASYSTPASAAKSKIALDAHAKWLALHKKLPHTNRRGCQICHPVRR